MYTPALLALVFATDPGPFAAENEISESISAAELRAHVYRLSSPEFMGRRGAGAARASQHIADAFRKLGLAPLFGDSYFQPIPWLLAPNGGPDRGFVGRNVGAVIPGRDPILKDEWIILSAHFDHLGQDANHLYPGADDNASAVAMLLEVAERFALRRERPRRTIAFVSFDLEEQGLQGSSHFAAHPPLPIDRLKAFLVGDLLGRSMANVMDEYLFVLGSESSANLRTTIARTPVPSGLTIGRLGADLVGTRSDYGPFRDRKVPFLFFTTGTHPDYHRPTDVPERVDYEKLTRVSGYVGTALESIANEDASPVWNSQGAGPDVEEARTVLALLSRVLDRPQTVSLTAEQRDRVRMSRDRLTEIIRRNVVTADERTWLVWTARILMATVF